MGCRCSAKRAGQILGSLLSTVLPFLCSIAVRCSILAVHHCKLCGNSHSEQLSIMHTGLLDDMLLQESALSIQNTIAHIQAAGRNGGRVLGCIAVILSMS